VQAESRRQSIDAAQVLEGGVPALEGEIQPSQRQAHDATLLYPHVMGMVRRLVSGQTMDRSAADRMDASILMDKFLSANVEWSVSMNVVESLADDLELAEGSDEAEALLGLYKFRERKVALGSISWRSFVLIYPTLRASGFEDLSPLNQVLEI